MKQRTSNILDIDPGILANTTAAFANRLYVSSVARRGEHKALAVEVSGDEIAKWRAAA